MSDNSQQQAPGTSPGDSAPQASSAVPVSPNPLENLPNPMAQEQQQKQPRDWEASFKGLNSRYQEDRKTWESERTQLTEAVEQLTDRLGKLEGSLSQAQAPAKPQDQAPTPDAGKKSLAPNLEDEIFGRLAEMEAERYRDSLLIEMTQPGQPGEGLNLFMFRENIPLCPPDVDDNGNVDGSAQRKAIETLIAKVKGTQAQSQQQTIAGWTPGSSPGAPKPKTLDEKMTRYEEVAALYASEELDSMSKADQDRIRNEYYDLIGELGPNIPGISMPWADPAETANSVQRLMAQMGIVMDHLKLK